MSKSIPNNVPNLIPIAMFVSALKISFDRNGTHLPFFLVTEKEKNNKLGSSMNAISFNIFNKIYD